MVQFGHPVGSFDDWIAPKSPERTRLTAIGVLPELRLRPSLSDMFGGGRHAHEIGVAGVQTPAFVERGS